MQGSNGLDALFTAPLSSLQVVVSENEALLACATKILVARYRKNGFSPVERLFTVPHFVNAPSLFAQNPIYIYHSTSLTECASIHPPYEGVLLLTLPKMALSQKIPVPHKTIQLYNPSISALKNFAAQYASLLGMPVPAGPFSDVLSVMNAVECAQDGIPMSAPRPDDNTFAALKAVLQQGAAITILEPFRADPLYLLGAFKYILRTMNKPVDAPLLDIEAGFKSSQIDAWSKLLGYILKIRGQEYKALLDS